MSKFRTRNVCPVPMCGWYAVTDHFSKKPNNLQDRMAQHLVAKHPFYRRWLVFALKRNLKKKAGAKK